MRVFEYTNKGGRALNQDYMTYAEVSEGTSVHVVADGMGGYEGGEVAARLVGDSILEFVRENFSKERPDILLSQAFALANCRLMQEREARDIAQMGSVVVAAMVVGNAVHIAWLGDSRAYLLREGAIEYVTEDHSLINELKAAGTFKESDRELYESCVTKSIMGDLPDSEPGYKALEVKAGDVLVLCSDGLHKELDVDMLPEEDEALRNLLDTLAPSMGDNCTIMRIKI